MENATQLIFQLSILIFSVVIHEVSHGSVALALGDKTAQYAGRLTLNPLKHLDIFGSVVLPLALVLLQSPILFGWAKPVPYNPYNLRNQKWGPALVGAAGPAANVALALAFGLLIQLLSWFTARSIPGPFVSDLIMIASTIVLLNLSLAFFNLVPISPLDGSKILFALLPYHWRGVQMFLEQYGFFFLLIFIFFFSDVLSSLVFFLFRLITGAGVF